jgi:hypothetical protein
MIHSHAARVGVEFPPSRLLSRAAALKRRRLDRPERELERLLLSTGLERHLLEGPRSVGLELLAGHRRLLHTDHGDELLSVVEHLRVYVNVQRRARRLRGCTAAT